MPKRGRGRGAARAPMRDLGADPVTGKAVVVRDGRFGVYVTDGTTNATVPKGTSVEELTLGEAARLLAERREAGPPKHRKTTRARRKG